MTLKTGVLLVNLGTPDSPETPDVRKYLRQFLMDGRVIDYPFIPRWMLVNLIIAPFRSPKSAKVYKEVWTDAGSPLKVYGYENETMLQQVLGDEYIVKLAMRYQEPSMAEGLETLQQQGVSKIIVVPFFPQYASATTGSVYEEVNRITSTWQTIPEIRLVNNFYQDPLFIEGFVKNAQHLLEKNEYEHFVFSYHGIPERQIHKGDVNGKTCALGSCCDKIGPHNQFCYRAQCMETTRLLVEKLGLKEGSYTTCFQSRLGKEVWVQPYTEEVVKTLAKEGKKKVLAFSPAFVADCLETTIEVGEEYKELFIEHGGQQWDLVESLNSSDNWIQLLEKLVKDS
ncbi:ferrochelatase [Marinilongibacter aquaticus]|uniref:ferrochelatase n=1 Tax=Marinilongibacter aquaticus TaxID=2975157 RepID=UPI0021BDC215|nr:ferrochelatase [Marinilongibacter aquaticus]UBM58124.1 ferrochelatase [Marinilongibacter aquaticus]